MGKDFSTLENSNRSGNPSIHDMSQPGRRLWLQGGAAAALGGLLAPLGGCAAPADASSPARLLGFEPVAPSSANAVVVPPGYVAQVLAAWGDPVGIGSSGPAFRHDAGNTAQEQAEQMGMHHDGMQFFPLSAADRGLLVMNHEYTDESLLHAAGTPYDSSERVRKSQAAHGVSVMEVQRAADGAWQPVRPSRWARRITASTPMALGGPAAGHPLMRTAADPHGLRVLGTFNNCASGRTPWGTYLAGEENFAGYFHGPQQPNAHERRWGLRPGGYGLGWERHDERFDVARHPNEPNRFGWIVEIDPHDPQSVPVKRTALGRGSHEGATVALTRDGRAVVYSGEDAAFEYIYKFVSTARMQPGGARANAHLLDRGTLYVARFDADGTGRWLPLVHGSGPLTASQGFADAGEVMIKTRQASDLLGATQMDRPEWLAVDAQGWVYCTLTNNTARGRVGVPGPDAANPRANNALGHIIRWKEDGDHDGERFHWNHFVLAGDTAPGRDGFGCPDALWVDGRGVLWIQTDLSPSSLNRGSAAALGNNCMLAADVRTGEIRRFLVGPVGCEVTGATTTPDNRTLFVNIQHPGEGPDEGAPGQALQRSSWPDFRPAGRPRSATVVVRRTDGGPIGT